MELLSWNPFRFFSTLAKICRLLRVFFLCSEFVLLSFPLVLCCSCSTLHSLKTQVTRSFEREELYLVYFSNSSAQNSLLNNCNYPTLFANTYRTFLLFVLWLFYYCRPRCYVDHECQYWYLGLKLDQTLADVMYRISCRKLASWIDKSRYYVPF